MKSGLFFGYNQSIDEGRITILAESLEIIKQQASTIQSLTEENSLLREQVAYLTQKLYGKSSEKNTVQPGQMSLFGEEETPSQEDSDLPR